MHASRMPCHSRSVRRARPVATLVLLLVDAWQQLTMLLLQTILVITLHPQLLLDDSMCIACMGNLSSKKQFVIHPGQAKALPNP